MTTSSNSWYHGVTRYQWLVLAIASLGWVFDAFEGQIYNLTRADMLPEILHVKADDPLVKMWGERFLGMFLLGGTLGGLLFSSLADKWGRNPVMALTILFYSIFSGLTAFADQIWQVGALRFLVAMGVGGEWAVGAALVAEVFPKKARERAGGIFHATSVCGLWLAAAVGLWVGREWRMAYLLGVLPALLVLWVRLSIKEPESWKAARECKKERMGSFSELLGDARWRSRAVFGALLAMVGLATFWGVVVAGQQGNGRGPGGQAVAQPGVTRPTLVLAEVAAEQQQIGGRCLDPGLLKGPLKAGPGLATPPQSMGGGQKVGIAELNEAHRPKLAPLRSGGHGSNSPRQAPALQPLSS
jgi:MFS family permease